MDEFPGTNYHDLNLDWIIDEIKKLREEWEEWQAAHQDPEEEDVL